MHSKKSLLLRQQLLIDQHVQGSLLRRTALYSCGCAVYFAVILVFTEVMSDPHEAVSSAIIRCFDEAIYWAPGLMLLTPVVAYDLLRVTNRFAGPMFRLRREMRRLIDGESKYPLNFREDDYWGEMAVIFNQIRDELHELRRENERMSRESIAVDEVVSQRQLFDHDDDGEASGDELFMNSIN